MPGGQHLRLREPRLPGRSHGPEGALLTGGRAGRRPVPCPPRPGAVAVRCPQLCPAPPQAPAPTCVLAEPLPGLLRVILESLRLTVPFHLIRPPLFASGCQQRAPCSSRVSAPLAPQGPGEGLPAHAHAHASASRSCLACETWHKRASVCFGRCHLCSTLIKSLLKGALPFSLTFYFLGKTDLRS